MFMTRHAELRCQERRISEKQLEWLAVLRSGKP